jgi:hypothetical protein
MSASFLGALGVARYLFHDTEPSSIINHARHVISIDENRQDFEPTLWSPKQGIDLQQVCFEGVRTDIGGGYLGHALGDLAGEWMAKEAQACGLGFDPHFLLRSSSDYAGRKHNEYKGFYRAMGRKYVQQVLYVSVKERWQGTAVTYKSPGLAALIERVGWDGIAVVTSVRGQTRGV